MNNIDLNILKKVVEQGSLSLSCLKAVFSWSLPTADEQFDAEDINNIITDNSLVFNSLNDVPTHLIDSSPSHISTEAYPGISIGNQNNILTHENKGVFSGEDVLYMPNTSKVKDFTVFLDMSVIPLQDSSKTMIACSNKNLPNDAIGWAITVNGSGYPAYEYQDLNGNKNTKTLLSKFGEKSLIAISKSKISNLVSIYVYDPALSEVHQQTFSIAEAVSIRDICVGGTFNSFTTDVDYERLTGDMNNFVFFDISMSSQNVLNIFESFFMTSYESEHYEEVLTSFPKPGKWLKTTVRDGVKIKEYKYIKVEFESGTGTKTVYNKVPLYEPAYKEELTFVNPDPPESITKPISILVPAEKTIDSSHVKTYNSDKCLLLNNEPDVSKNTEIYPCDEFSNNLNKKAVFRSGDSTFELQEEYDPDEIHIAVDGLLLEPSQYEVNGKKIKKVEGLFTETNVLTYDIYPADKIYFAFYGYNGNIYLYGYIGRDIYLNGEKLIKDINYIDIDPDYLMIYGTGLPSGRLGIVQRYNNINTDKITKFTGKYLECLDDVIFDEMVWIDNKRVTRGNEYSLTETNNLNSSEHLASKKTTAIYSGEGDNFYA